MGVMKFLKNSLLIVLTRFSVRHGRGRNTRPDQFAEHKRLQCDRLRYFGVGLRKFYPQGRR